MKKPTKLKKISNKSDMIILKTATSYLIPLLLMFSVFILLRGHYLSGGGFVGGLIASIAFILYAFAHTVQETLKLFKFPPLTLIPVGISLSFLSGFLPVLAGKPFLTGLWLDVPVAIVGSVGTALFFDLGVYLIVIGVTLTIIFTIIENV